MSLEVPPSAENESLALPMDLLESDSVIDLLQASSNDDMFYLSDDVPFFNPMSATQSLQASISGEDKDIVKQDALIGTYFQNCLSSTDIDDDVFLAAPLAQGVPPAAQHVFAKPVRPPPTRTAKLFHRPNPRAINQYVINPLVSSQKPATKKIHVCGKVSKTRACPKTTSRTPIIKPGVQSPAKTPTRISVGRNTAHALSNRSKHRNIFFISKAENASSSTRPGSVGRATVTHTVTRTVDSLIESPLSFTSETNTITATTVARTIGHRTAVDSLCGFTTRAKYPKTTTGHPPCSGTSTITSQTASKARVAETVAPTRSTFAVPLYPSPMIIPPPSPSGSRKYAEVKPATSSTASNRDDDDCTLIRTTEVTTRSCKRIIVPVTVNPYTTSEALGIITTSTSIPHSAPKTRFCATMLATQSTPSVTIPGIASATVARRKYAVVPTRSTCAIPPGATLYAPTTTPSVKTSRLQAVPVTAAQTFAIDDGLGSYTTLTNISDRAKTTTASYNPVATTQITATSKPVAESDSTVRPRSQLLIPIASTSTGISYLMTSTISSLPEVAAVGTHIATMRPDASNRTRTRFILPVAQNVSSSQVSVGLSSTMDSNRSRNTLAIISPQIASTLDISGNPGIGTIRAFAIAKPPSAFLSPDTERVTKSRSSAAKLTEPCGSADPDDLSSITALLTSDLTSSSIKTTESVTRSGLSRIFMPFIQSTSNAQNSASVGSTAVTTRVLAQSTYILTSAIGTSANSACATPKQSHRVVIPIIHSSATVTTATTATARTLTTDFTSSMMGTTDVTSRLRNRLLVPTVSANVDSYRTDNSAVGTSSITAYTITRGRAPLTSVPVQSGLSRSSETFNPLSSSMTHGMFAANTAYISIATTTVVSTVTTVAQSVTSSDLSSSTHSTSAAPALTSTGHRYVIKLSTTQSASSPGTGTAPASNTIPITSSTGLSTHEQSRLRIFPAPRTYSITQRNVSKSERNVSPRPAVSKRIITTPAPLQIFPDIVCPQTVSTLATTALTHNYGQAGPRFTLSQTSGSSTLIVPQYKNTVFKNLSTIAHPIPSASRLPNVPVSTERLILKRSVTCVTPRRTFPITQVSPHRSTQMVSVPRMTSGDPSSEPSPNALLSPDLAAQPVTQPTTNDLPFNASENVHPAPAQEQYG